MELLHQKVETLARAAAGAENAPHFGHVRGEPLHFLGDVDLGREQSKLLLQPLLIGIESCLFQARSELVEIGLMEHRNARCNARDLQFDLGAAFFQRRGELGALAPPGSGELRERLADEIADERCERLRCDRGFGEHTGPAQDFSDRKRRCTRNLPLHVDSGLRKVTDALRGHRKHRGSRGCPIERNPAFDLAALQIRCQALA